MGNCQKNDDPLPAITQIIKGELISHNWSLGDVVITNQTDWTSFSTLLNSYLKVQGNPQILETIIDFKKNSVVVVFDAIKGNKGYSVDIAQLTENNSNIIVTVLHDAIINSSEKVITQSFVIVKIPKPTKPIAFEHESKPPRIYIYSLIQGALKGNSDIAKQDIVITNKQDWTQLLIQMNIDADIDLLTYFPEIDFNKFMISARSNKRECLSPCSSSISRDITDIIETENSILVTVQSLWITLTEGYPQPFHCSNT